MPSPGREHPPTSFKQPSRALLASPLPQKSKPGSNLPPITTTRESKSEKAQQAVEPDSNEVALRDESRFSTVPLSAVPLSSSSSGSNVKSKSLAMPTVDDSPVSPDPSQHRETGSTSSTIATPGNNASFILARLDMQKVQDESADSKTHRGSVDGQQKIQEEFARRQKERDDEVEGTSSGAIDWGELRFGVLSIFHSLLSKIFGVLLFPVRDSILKMLYYLNEAASDYQEFAAENAERLARAIETGIPDTLRGMVWQLMYAVIKCLESYFSIWAFKGLHLRMLSWRQLT
jgi:hypothetical protein